MEDGSREIKDDEVLASLPLKVQLVVLEFWPPDDDKMISAGTMIRLCLKACCNARKIPTGQTKLAEHHCSMLQSKDMFKPCRCYWKQEQRPMRLSLPKGRHRCLFQLRAGALTLSAC